MNSESLKTSSIGAVWPPSDASFDRIRGFYPEVIRSDAQAVELGESLADTANKFEDTEATRLSVRAVLSGELLTRVGDITDAIGIEAAMPVFVDDKDPLHIVYFGSNKGEIPEKTSEAVRILHEKYPNMIVDGEMQANFALNPELLKDNFGFSTLNGKPANTLIFPGLASGNIAYKLLQEIGGAEAVGPILLGLKKPVHVLQLGSSVREIVNMVTIAVIDAQVKCAKENKKPSKAK